MALVRVMRKGISETTTVGAAAAAWLDLRQSLRNWRVWMLFGWNDIRLRYRRTILGPFWLTASTAVMIGSMGVVYSILFNQDVRGFFPYLTIGIIVWSLIATVINEGCLAFVERADVYKNSVQPYFYAVLRVITRNLIVFAHNLIIFVAVAMYFHVNALHTLPFFLLSLAGGFVNAMWVVVILATTCARFRDISQLVGSLMNVFLMVTPVFWPKELLGTHAYIVWLNPFTHFLETLRGPLLGVIPPLGSYAVVWMIALLGWLFGFYLFARFRARIVDWL